MTPEPRETEEIAQIVIEDYLLKNPGDTKLLEDLIIKALDTERSVIAEKEARIKELEKFINDWKGDPDLLAKIQELQSLLDAKQSQLDHLMNQMMENQDKACESHIIELAEAKSLLGKAMEAIRVILKNPKHDETDAPYTKIVCHDSDYKLFQETLFLIEKSQ